MCTSEPPAGTSSLRLPRGREADEPTVVVVGAAIVRDGRVLAARRVRPPEVAGGWELPGGKAEPGETPEEAVVREVREELGCDIAVTRMLPGEVPVKPGYVLRVALADLVSGGPGPVPREHDAVRWLAPEELHDVRWLDADLPFLPTLHDLLLEGARLPSTEKELPGDPCSAAP